LSTTLKVKRAGEKKENADAGNAGVVVGRVEMRNDANEAGK